MSGVSAGDDILRVAQLLCDVLVLMIWGGGGEGVRVIRY